LFSSGTGERDSGGQLSEFVFQNFADFNRALIDVGSPIINQDLKSSGASDSSYATALAALLPEAAGEVDTTTVRDEFSKMILEMRAVDNGRTETVRSCFESLFAAHGLPAATLETFPTETTPDGWIVVQV
jgi:hypothetical protein